MYMLQGMNNLNPMKDIILTENDVPGAKLPFAAVEANNMKDLKRFLKCRGIPYAKQKKRVLVARLLFVYIFFSLL